MADTGRTRAQELLGDTAPDLVRLTDDVLFGDVWANPGLSHLQRALAKGLTRDDLVQDRRVHRRPPGAHASTH